MRRGREHKKEQDGDQGREQDTFQDAEQKHTDQSGQGVDEIDLTGSATFRANAARPSISPETAINTTVANTAFGKSSSSVVKNKRQRARVSEANTSDRRERAPAPSLTADCD